MTKLYDPNVSTPISRRRLQRAGIIGVEKHLQRLGYPGRIYILDTNEFTVEGLWSFGFDLMERGDLLKLPVVHYPMKPQCCHSNVRKLIDGRYPFLQEWRGIGYNAAERGWVHHSWGVNDKNGTIIETTTPFDAYYGCRTFYEEYRRQVVGASDTPEIGWHTGVRFDEYR